MENSIRAPKRLGTELSCDPTKQFLGIYPKECKSDDNKGTCTPMFIAALFIIVSYSNSQDAPLLKNGLRKCGIYVQWNFIQPQRRMKFCHLQKNGWNWRTSS
jgi:hypothetical protein